MRESRATISWHSLSNEEAVKYCDMLLRGRGRDVSYRYWFEEDRSPWPVESGKQIKIHTLLRFKV